MPELPEVETIARVLRDGSGDYQTSIIGCQVTRAVLLWERTLAAPAPGNFKSKLSGKPSGRSRGAENSWSSR